MKEFDAGESASIVSVTDRVRPLPLGIAVSSVYFLGDTAHFVGAEEKVVIASLAGEVSSVEVHFGAIRCSASDGARIVTFGNGMVVRELIVDVDDAARRVAWSAVGGSMTHHNASAQVLPDGGGCRFVWIADLLPHDVAPAIAAMIEQGLGVIKATLERTERERAA